jgi:hypothetical protein
LPKTHEALHPGLYRHNDKAQIDAAFAVLNYQLDHDESLQAAGVGEVELHQAAGLKVQQADPLRPVRVEWDPVGGQCPYETGDNHVEIDKFGRRVIVWHRTFATRSE